MKHLRLAPTVLILALLIACDGDIPASKDLTMPQLNVHKHFIARHVTFEESRDNKKSIIKSITFENAYLVKPPYSATVVLDVLDITQPKVKAPHTHQKIEKVVVVKYDFLENLASIENPFGFHIVN